MNAAIYKIDGREYKFAGGLGCQLYSQERGRMEGDCRVILGRLFSVYGVTYWHIGPFKWNVTVSWALVVPPNATLDEHNAAINDFQSALRAL